jgi:5'-phosphate synthase pdxT subunit
MGTPTVQKLDKKTVPDPVFGILALQGGFAAHVEARGGGVLVRNAEDFAAIDVLVLPGGESGVMLRLIERFGLRAALEAFYASGKPVVATCAGLILCAAKVERPRQESFGWIDVDVVRNGWGRQIDSFNADSDRGAPLVFIRAPRITRVGSGVEVLDTFEGEPVHVRQRNVTAMTFHPELVRRGGRSTTASPPSS